MEKYINLHISIKEEFFDPAFGIISDYAIEGVEERLDELVVTFNSNNYDKILANRLIERLKLADSDAAILREDVIDEKNWNEEWEKEVPAIVASEKIGIAPSWKLSELQTEIKIQINPKMSFGVGSHATTRLVCRLIEKYSKPEKLWIDAGCGAGVLAVLAAKLGAKHILAFDNNDWAVDNSIENVAANNVESLVDVQKLDIEEIELPQADFIAANLFRHLIIDSMPLFANSLKFSKGTLFVSGILIYDKDEIIDIAKINEFNLIDYINEDEWAALAFKRR